MFATIKFGILSLTALAQIESPRRDTIPIPASVQSARTAGTRDVNGAPGARYWQLRPSYALEAHLDPRRAILHGSGTLTFTNDSPVSLDQIVLRLDQNRFRAGSGSPVTTRGIAIRRLEIGGRVIDLKGPRVDGLASTVARVRLVLPLRPRDSLTVRMNWDYEVPAADEDMTLRQGRSGTDVFQIAQWYPRLAMFDDLGGWDIEPHDGSKEFFNHFARFAVSLRVPAGWIVGATGLLQNSRDVLGTASLDRLRAAERADTTLQIVGPRERGIDALLRPSSARVWKFSADSVSDFAWGTSSRYAWAVSSLTLPSGRLLVHALLTPKRADSSLAIASRSAKLLGRLSHVIRPYSWNVHTLVDGPEGAMEYPMLTMSNGSTLAHELAHQWFPIQVGSDETRFDFLDEGFASFYADVVSERALGRRSSQPATQEPLLLANDVRRSRATLGYGRGSRMMHALVARFGEERVLSAIRRYFDEWRSKHPSPWDFMASMERYFGQRLDDFWIKWLFLTDEIP